jgi:hypothetical protein
MQTPPADALVETISAERIAVLARLYDRFAHALDPFSEERDQAERVFAQELADLYDRLQPPKPEFQVFRRKVILRCRATCALRTSRARSEFGKVVLPTLPSFKRCFGKSLTGEFQWDFSGNRDCRLRGPRAALAGGEPP